MRILIYGATDAGYIISSQLCLTHDITLIDEQENLPERFAGLDISYVTGTGSDITTLRLASENGAQLFIACTTMDEANIVACWSIKRITEIRTLCFISRSEIYNTLTSPDRDRYLTQYDIDRVIWPEHLLTQDIFRIVTVPGAIDVEYFDNGNISLLEYRIDAQSGLTDRLIMDYPFPPEVLIVGITRDNSLFIPNGSSVIKNGDRVIFMGLKASLDLLAADLFEADRKISGVTVIGGGNVGFTLARLLEKLKLKVKIIEHSKERCTFLADNLHRCLVLHGDGTDLELLEEESIGNTDVAVCVTDNDEKNLLCALLAKQLGVQRVITRISNVHNAALFEKVGIDVVVSPRESAMRELHNMMQDQDMDILAMIGGGQAEVVRIGVPNTFSAREVRELAMPSGAIIGAVKRQREIIIPNGLTVIQAGDHIAVVTTPDTKQSVEAVFFP